MNKKILARIGIGYLILNIGAALGMLLEAGKVSKEYYLLPKRIEGTDKNAKENKNMPDTAKVGDIIVYKDGITEDLEDTYSAAFVPNENYEKLVRAAAQCGKVKNAIVDIVYKDLDEKPNTVS